MATGADLDVEIGLTLGRLTRELAAAEARMVKAAKKSEDAFQKANRNAGASFAQVSRAANKELTQISALTARAGTAASGFAKNFALGFAGGVLGATALTSALSNAVAELGNLADVSQRLGISTDVIQGLQAAFLPTGVSIEETNKALEQFSRRIGDAAGGGAFLKTLQAFGIELRDNEGNIRSTTDLLFEYSDALSGLTEAQRLAAAQAAFGRGGLALVNGLAGGSEALRQQIEDAKEAGLVVDAELIKRADELGDKFDLLKLRAKVFFQEVAIGSVGFLDTAIQKIKDTSNAFDEFGAGIVGEAPRVNLDTGEVVSTEATDSSTASMDALAAANENVRTQAEATVDVLNRQEVQLRALGQTDAADKINAINSEMQGAIQAFEDGQISAGELTQKLGEVGDEAIVTVNSLGQIDGISFAGTIASLGGLVGAIQAAGNAARAALGAVAALASARVQPGPGAPKAESERGSQADLGAIQARQAQDAFLAGKREEAALTSEQIALDREVADLKEDAADAGVVLSDGLAKQTAAQLLATEAAVREGEAQARASATKGGSGGGGGGGGGGRAAEVDKEVQAREKLFESTAQTIEQLEFEASLIGKSANEAARLREEFELLAQAKRAGIAVDQQVAGSSQTVGQALSAQAAQISQLRIETEFAKAQSEFFADTAKSLASAFLDAAITGEGFESALAGLARQIAEAALQGALFGSGPLGGLFGNAGNGLLSGLLPGFATGGYTGRGGKYQPAGVVHKGEYVFDKASTDRIGPENLEAMRRNMRGFATGGMAGGVASGGGRGSPKVNVVLVDDPNRVGEYLTTREGEQAVMRVVQRNGIASNG